jgi:hypothetical protein
MNTTTPRGGSRPTHRPRRTRFYNDAGVRALANEVIIQAIGDVRDGIAKGYITRDGTAVAGELWATEYNRRQSVEARRCYQRSLYKVRTRVTVLAAAEFLRNKACLTFWLQLAGWTESAAEFARVFWRQMQREQPIEVQS